MRQRFRSAVAGIRRVFSRRAASSSGGRSSGS